MADNLKEAARVRDNMTKLVKPTLPERFAIPYSFKPRLTLAEAVISVCGAFLRIVLGSLLFGVWGSYSFLAWSTIHNVALRCAALLALVSAFAAAMTCLMLAISAGVRMVWPQREDRA